MKAKLKVIKNWEFEEFELTGTSFKYSPTGCKGMVARSEDEIVFWTYHFVQKCSGVLWVKGEVSRWIPSPEPKEQQDVWEDPVLLSCDRGIIKKFPPCIASTHTALVLKEPKTKTSIRRVYLPKTVAKMLVDRKAEIDELKDLFGDEYIDNDLVFCTSNGRPMESQIINRAFNKLIKENGFPHVVFHSLRHSSITYKLKLNGGDMKAVQGDSGHAQMKMVADVYSHIIDEDRCINAQRFEDAFYSQAKAPEPAIQEIEEKETGTTTPESDTAKILELLKNPETAALLKQIVSAL